MAKIQYTIPDDRKEMAEQILEAQGLTPQVAINMLYIEVINIGGLPFQSSQVKIPNEETLKAFDESTKGKNLLKHKTPKEMLKALKND